MFKTVSSFSQSLASETPKPTQTSPNQFEQTVIDTTVTSLGTTKSGSSTHQSKEMCKIDAALMYKKRSEIWLFSEGWIHKYRNTKGLSSGPFNSVPVSTVFPDCNGPVTSAYYHDRRFHLISGMLLIFSFVRNIDLGIKSYFVFHHMLKCQRVKQVNFVIPIPMQNAFKVREQLTFGYISFTIPHVIIYSKWYG